jgi:hypothetical protein
MMPDCGDCDSWNIEYEDNPELYNKCRSCCGYSGFRRKAT